MKGIIIFIFLLFVLPSYSQPVFDHIGTGPGLSSAKTQAIIQDKQGFYWIATSEGLNRFDGSVFKIFRHNKNDSTTISHNVCTDLLEDKQGDIWVATMQGVNRYIRKKGIFKHYVFHHPALKDDLVNTVLGLAIDDEGNIWATSFGLWKIDVKEETITGYIHNDKDNTSIPDATQCHWILFDGSRRGFWLRTSSEVCFFNKTKREFYHHNYNPEAWPIFQLKSKAPFLTINTKGELWIYDEVEKKLYSNESKSNTLNEFALAFPHHLAKFSNDGNGKLIFSFELIPCILFDWKTKQADTLRYSPQQNIQRTNHEVNYYYKDHFNNIWLCSLDGLYVAKNTEKKHETYLIGDQDNGMVRSISAMIKRGDSLWIGIQNKLYVYDPAQKKLSLVLEYPSPHNFRPLYNAGDTILWAACNDKLILVNFKSRKIVKQIEIAGGPYFVLTDKQKNFWVGTWSDGFYKLFDNGRIFKHYTVEDGLKSNDLVCGYMDSDDNLWLGFNGGSGFDHFNMRQNKFEHFLIGSGKNKAGEINTITSIIPGENGHLWLGTYGSGLYDFNYNTHQYSGFRTEDGLSGDYINTLNFDRTGNLWISTSNGIDFMNRATNSFYHLNENMEFASNDHINNLVVAGVDNLFYFSKNKIIHLQPSRYEEPYNTAEIVISEVKVFNKELPDPYSLSSISLPYNKNFFTITFSVLKVSPAIPANYKYKLEGFDNNWIDAGGRGVANYTNVPAGKYTLLLNVTDETGRWKKDPMSIRIIISPPFWETWWFITLVSISILSILYLFYRYRIGELKKLYSLRSKISQDLHDEVASTLSGIRLYSEMAKEQLQSKNSEAIQKSLQVISTNANEMAQDMSDIIWTINPSNDSFKKLLQKLKSYSHEISSASNMRFEYKINEQFAEEKLDMQQRRNIYLICKEAVNNAVKYSAGKSLLMDIERSDHSIIIKIRDDGNGFKKENINDGNGLINMQARAKEINAKLDIRSQIKEGTCVELTVKLD